MKKQELFNNVTEGFPYQRQPQQVGLYDAAYEHDACGVGMLVNIHGEKSHDIVESALKVLENMRHRGAEGADNKTGDGAGIMLQIPHEFILLQGIPVPEKGRYGTGLLFLPKNEKDQAAILSIIIEEIEKEGLTLMHLRNVPTCPEILGESALANEPDIKQVFITGFTETETADRKLYLIRKRIENKVRLSSIPAKDDFYVVSLSTKSIIYKGMLSSLQLRNYYPDLTNSYFTSGLALVHSRFSTNTFPTWGLAQPFRLLAHNGEINTIRGNRGWMEARESVLSTPTLGDIKEIRPIIQPGMSDSASLDNVLEFLVMSGLSLPHAMAMLVPESFNEKNPISEDLKSFYEYHSILMEPWDGPAALLFSDGRFAGGMLDRNGLRPARYLITKNDMMVVASEVGVMDFEPGDIKEKGRLQPGKILLVDTEKGEIYYDGELKKQLAEAKPYRTWLSTNRIELDELKSGRKVPHHVANYDRMLRTFGYSKEDIERLIMPMASTGAEPINSMGNDTPLAVLSDKPQLLYNYFRQQFAQVTNPPIDSIREKVVTSTTVYLGSDGNVLEEKPENCKQLRINNPILTNTDILKIKNMKVDGFKVETIPIIYYKNTSLEKAIDHLYVEADRAHREGANIIILSDRGVDENHVAIPSLLAVSALQQYLVQTKKRTSMAVILESGEPRDVHHFATLLGYGASAINPYLAQESIQELIDLNMLDKDYYAAVDDYNNAIISGIVKIAAKMGISTIQSYQGAKIFEAIGINSDVINKYFTGTVSRIEGIGLKDIQEDVETLHSKAFDPLGLSTDTTLDSEGAHKMRSGKEEHLYNPQTIHLLQLAARTGDYNTFKEYTALVNKEEGVKNLRGLMDIKFPKKGINIDQVESVDSIVKRFKTGAMSYGSISKEAHETMAIAMNMLHGKSNSGEGGEDEDRLTVGADGLNRCSAIKQVASGRFGVTSKYLVSAKEIQIKMAQGAKPGEGGHLPGKKVYPWIAKTRLSTPGVSLISPPPHHDIYSIEDLAQLIYDLKNANKNARISVKLVSEAGVGTIASGVAKAGAQVILISGYDGGTGAAPRSSIHNAGLPWELGLAEAHQTLTMNGLRNKVIIETDGKLMSGRDVAIAAMLGAEEFGFATAPLVTMGCVMMRVCNLDTCPVGIATQNPELRKRFAGKPEYVVNFMRFIAQELREYMAKLGVKTVDELVGRTDFLEAREDVEGSGRASKVDLSNILNNPYVKEASSIKYDKKNVYDFELEKTVDEKILIKKLSDAMDKKQKRSVEVDVTNTDRALGTLLGAEITRRFGESLAEDTYTVKCTGAGGQSFGAFIPKGLTLELVGDSNDYFGKGLSGGKLIVYPPTGVSYKEDENIIIGNVALYGATSGKAFINGVAGERFCVRNSGATAVVEGTGDHGCEYMTGGRVVVLGRTGKNFAAGMSGGVAYVLDDDTTLYKRVNKQLVSLEPVTNKYDVLELKQMITEHVAYTNSKKGKEVLDNFGEYLPKFKKIMPHDYKKMLNMIVQMEEKGLSSEQAQIEAFYAATK